MTLWLLYVAGDVTHGPWRWFARIHRPPKCSDPDMKEKAEKRSFILKLSVSSGAVVRSSSLFDVCSDLMEPLRSTAHATGDITQ